MFSEKRVGPTDKPTLEILIVAFCSFEMYIFVRLRDLELQIV